MMRVICSHQNGWLLSPSIVPHSLPPPPAPPQVSSRDFALQSSNELNTSCLTLPLSLFVLPRMSLVYHAVSVKCLKTSSSILHLFKTSQDSKSRSSFKHFNIFVIQDLKISNLSHRSVHPVDDASSTGHLPTAKLLCIFTTQIRVTSGILYVDLSHRISLTPRSSTGYLCRQTVFRGWGLSFGTSTAIFLSLPSITMCRRLWLVLPIDVPWNLGWCARRSVLSHGTYILLINVLICD
jgi:hypothetical protein